MRVRISDWTLRVLFTLFSMAECIALGLIVANGR